MANYEDYEDYEEYEDEEDDEELEEQFEEEERRAREEEKKRHEIEEKILKNKLRAIFSAVSSGERVTLKFGEKIVMKRAKAFPKLKGDINRINAVLTAKKARKIYKVISSGPVLYYVLIAALIIVLLIILAAIIGSIVGSAGMNQETVSGITGDDFYGARMVYVDENRSTSNIIEDYVELIVDGIDETENINSVTILEQPYTVEIEININVPTEYDYSMFVEEDFSGEYLSLYNIVYDIAKVVYKIDNAADFTGNSLVECVNGIKYFGIANIDEIASILANNFEQNLDFTAKDNGGAEVVETAILEAIKGEIKTETNNKLSTILNNEDYLIRAEKLFVKDYILIGSEEMLSGIEKQNYVAMIFMAKNKVTLNQFSFVISNTTFENFTINMTINGNNYDVETDESNIALEEDQEAYVYSTPSINVSVDEFEDIDTQNLNSLAEGLSLIDIVKNVDDYSIYLTGATDVNENEYLTVKKNGAVVNLYNTEAFNFVEWETTWR